MPPRPSPKPAASPELLAALLGPPQSTPATPSITINVAAGGTLNLVVGTPPAAQHAAE